MDLIEDVQWISLKTLYCYFNFLGDANILEFYDVVVMYCVTATFCGILPSLLIQLLADLGLSR
jgi:hypothetical protein